MLALLICSTLSRDETWAVKREGRLEVKKRKAGCVSFEFHSLIDSTVAPLFFLFFFSSSPRSHLLFSLCDPAPSHHRDIDLNVASMGSCNKMVFIRLSPFSLTLSLTLLYFLLCKPCPSPCSCPGFPAASFHNPLFLSSVCLSAPRFRPRRPARSALETCVISRSFPSSLFP